MIRYLITGSSVVWTRLCATTTHAFLNVGTSLVLQPGSAETATWGREGKARAVVRPSHRGGSGLSGGWNRLPGNPHTRQVWGTERSKCNYNLNISHEYLLSNLLNLFGIYFEQFQIADFFRNTQLHFLLDSINTQYIMFTRLMVYITTFRSQQKLIQCM